MNKQKSVILSEAQRSRRTCLNATADKEDKYGSIMLY